jgi:hypothetical protein
MAFWFLAIPELLLPGFVWILISGLSKRLGALEKISLSFILSVSFTALLTAALSFLTSSYLLYSSIISLAAPAFVLLIFLLKGDCRYPSLRLRMDWESVTLLVAICTYVVVLVSLFWSAPYYPSADSFDPVTHARVVNAILNGGGRNEVLHGEVGRAGIHFVAATLSGLFSIDALQSLRILLSLIILNSLVLVYSSARVLFGEKRIAGVTVLVAAFVFPVDAVHFIRVGTFANVAGDALILTMFLLFFSYVKRPCLPLGITLAFLGVAGTFMHSGFLLFLAVLWASTPLVYLKFRRTFRNYLQGVAYSTAGLLFLGVMLTSVFARNLNTIYSSYVVIAHPSLLNTDSYFITLVEFAYNFSILLGPVSMAAVFLAMVLVVKRQRHSAKPVFAAFWFIFLVVVSLLTFQDWRFILFSFLPATFLVGGMIGWAPGLIAQSRDMSDRIKKKVLPIIVPLALCALVLSGTFLTSGFFGIVSRAYDPSERARQQAVFDSMVWLKQNSCSSGVASVGLEMDYRYLPALTGIQYVGDFDKPANELQQRSQIMGFHCLAVALANQNFQTFQVDNAFHEEYRNDVVALFTIS